MNDQMAMMPAQLALRCISQCLRGGLPLVLGIAAITMGGTVLGAVQGVRACKKALEKPKAGENKASKIMNVISRDKKAGDKEAEIFAFELDKDFYKPFAEKAKKAGIPYAVINDGKTMHMIADARNGAIIDVLAKTSEEYTKRSTFKPYTGEGSEDTNGVVGEIKPLGGTGTGGVDANAANNTPADQEPPYKQVDFEQSLWHKAMQFVQEKFLNPFIGKQGVIVDQAEDMDTIRYDRKDKGVMSAIGAEIEKNLAPLKTGFGGDYVRSLMNEVQKGGGLEGLAPKKEDVADKTPLKGIEGEFNAYIGDKQNKKNKTQDTEDEQMVQVDSPEVHELIVANLYRYLVANEHDEEKSFRQLNEDLRDSGFRGSISLEEGSVITSFAPKDKNHVTAFAKNPLQYAKEGSVFRTGLEAELMAENAENSIATTDQRVITATDQTTNPRAGRGAGQAPSSPLHNNPKAPANQLDNFSSPALDDKTMEAYNSIDMREVDRMFADGRETAAVPVAVPTTRARA